VLLPLAGPEQMHDMLPAGMQELCDQAPVATPPQGLRAHEAGSRLGQRRGQRRLPPLSAHPGGIAAERSDSKTAEAILARLTSEAAAKLDRVPVGDPALLQHRGESWLVELGVMPRAWKAPHINKRADAGLAGNRDELFRRPSPMADRAGDHRAKDNGVDPSGARRNLVPPQTIAVTKSKAAARAYRITAGLGARLLLAEAAELQAGKPPVSAAAGRSIA
jgi:hypothetical protein